MCSVKFLYLKIKKINNLLHIKMLILGFKSFNIQEKRGKIQNGKEKSNTSNTNVL